MGLHEDHEHSGHLPGLGHAPQSFGAAFAVATLLNVALVAIQVVYGILAHSVALLADAGHNLGDVIGLLLAWGADRTDRSWRRGVSLPARTGSRRVGVG